MSYIYEPPILFKSKFTCPHCGAIARQGWDGVNWSLQNTGVSHHGVIRVATCDHCEMCSLWYNDSMLFPFVGTAQQANSDMPKPVVEIYSEASTIVSKSPRAAAALLRLAVQQLCKELDESGKDLNQDIGNLVKKGLPDRVQKALDIVRVTGNNAVHPGQIDVDDENVVTKLFELINIIVDYTISMPNQVGKIYDDLPSGALEQIEKRDGEKE